MANKDMVMEAMAADITTLLTGTIDPDTSAPYVLNIGCDWPDEDALQEVGRGTYSLIAIADHGFSKEVTRWMPFTVSQTDYVCGTGSTLSNNSVFVGHPITLTLSYANAQTAVQVNDAVSFGVNNPTPTVEITQQTYVYQDYAVAIAVGGDTLSTMATKLAAAINGRTLLGTWVSATATGAVVTITALVPSGGMSAYSYSGNRSQRGIEYKREQSDIQVALFTFKLQARKDLSLLIAPRFAYLRSNFGLPLADGTVLTMLDQRDRIGYDDTNKDILRYDLIQSVEYGLIFYDYLYPILAPIQSATVQ